MNTKFLLFLSLCFLVSACSGGANKNSGLTPMPPSKTDPTDSNLIGEINKYLASRSAPSNSQYDYVRYDLNNDGLREGLVLFKTPYSYWCGWAGCSLVIFNADDNRFNFNTEMTRVRGPIYIHQKATKGYKDIILGLSGTNMSNKNVVMQYDGKKYPANPMTEPELTDLLTPSVSKGFFF